MIRKYIIVADDSIKGFDEGIEKLEREWGAEEIEPCEDCISRQAVLNTLFYKSDNNCEVVLNKELQDRIKALPSVTPQPKMGRWIDIDCQSYTWQIKCPYCNHSRSMMSTQGIYPNYCENCGRKMEV